MLNCHTFGSVTGQSPSTLSQMMTTTRVRSMGKVQAWAIDSMMVAWSSLLTRTKVPSHLEKRLRLLSALPLQWYENKFLVKLNSRELSKVRLCLNWRSDLEYSCSQSTCVWVVNVCTWHWTSSQRSKQRNQPAYKGHNDMCEMWLRVWFIYTGKLWIWSAFLVHLKWEWSQTLDTSFEFQGKRLISCP